MPPSFRRTEIPDSARLFPRRQRDRRHALVTHYLSSGGKMEEEGEPRVGQQNSEDVIVGLTKVEEAQQ